MIPLVRDKFSEIDGACDYFSLLDQENDKISEEQREAQQASTKKEPAKAARQLYPLPQGFPLRHVQKQPRLDPATCQIEVSKELYAGSPPLLHSKAVTSMCS